MHKNAKIFVTGHRGMVGSALVRRLQAGGYTNIITRSRQELDLLSQAEVQQFLADEQPINEEYLLTGALECTNEPYAIAEIKLCEAYNAQYRGQYVRVMPTNLYGSNNNYDLATSHVLPLNQGMRLTYENFYQAQIELFSAHA